MTQSELQVQILTNAMQSMSHDISRYAMDYHVLMAQFERLQQENKSLIEKMEQMKRENEETPSE